MMAAKSRWLAYAFCCTFIAACGGNDAGAPESKTFDTPQDGAQLSEALTNLFNKVSGTPPQGKAMRAKVSTACPDGGSYDFTDEAATPFIADGDYIFTHCASTDQSSGDKGTLDGEFILECTDPNQDQTNCNSNDANITLGRTGLPLTAEFTHSPIDVLASFYGFAVTLADDNNEQTDTLTLDGRLSVADFGPTNCGSADFTVNTIQPLTVAQSDLSQVSAGEVDLTAADGSSANVVFNADGSETVTVSGVAHTFNPQDLASFCGGI